jgi:hypothetical protein
MIGSVPMRKGEGTASKVSKVKADILECHCLHGVNLYSFPKLPDTDVILNLSSEMNKTFFFFAVLGFELRAYTLSHSTSPFFVKGFLDRVS